MSHGQLFLLIIFLLDLALVECFYPNQLNPFISGQDYTHEDITEIGLLEAAEDILSATYEQIMLENNSGDSIISHEKLTTRALFDKYFGYDCSDRRFRQAVDIIVRHNIYVDLNYRKFAEWHFNGEQIQQGHTKMVGLRQRIIRELSQSVPDYTEVREFIGQYFHLLQMFYSNTNWIELKGNRVYTQLGLPGNTILPTATREKDTCKVCSSTDSCTENLINNGDMLTSGYKTGQNIHIPHRDEISTSAGKCRHGGPGDIEQINSTYISGINKDTGNPLYSPHYNLHTAAASVAIQHTRMFFSDPEFGLLKYVKKEKLNRLLGLTCENTKVFVLDSDSVITHEAVSTIKSITDTIVTQCEGHAEYRFILASISGSASEITIRNTSSLSTLYDWLHGLDTGHQHPCKQTSTKAIKQALKVADSYSKVYIFTDNDIAIPDDTHVIMRMALENEMLIKVMKSDQCKDVFQHGHAYVPGDTFQDINYRVLSKRSYTRILSASRDVSLMSLDMWNRGTTTIPIDSAIHDLSITISTQKESVRPILRMPNGKYWKHISTTRGTQNSKIFHIKIEKPQAGTWFLYKTDHHYWSIEVEGRSLLDVRCTLIHSGNGHIQYRQDYLPVTGKSQRVAIEPSSKRIIKKVLSLVVEVGSKSKQKMVNLTEHTLNGASYQSTTFIVPGESYRLYAEGIDRKGFHFRRQCSGEKLSKVSKRHKRALSTWNVPSAFSQISTITGGQVYQGTSNNQDNANQLLQGALNFNEVMILRLKLPGGSGGYNSVSLPIDETVSQFSVIIDGITGRPPYRLLNPSGNGIKFFGNTQNTSASFIGNTVIRLDIKDPEHGPWTLLRQDNKAWDLQVIAQSKLEFTTKLMKTASTGYTQYEIPGRPVIGEILTAVITVNDESKISTVDVLYLLDDNGQQITQYSLTAKTGGHVHGVYYTNVTIPNQKFRLAIEGHDNNAEYFRRLDLAMMTPVDVDITILSLSGPFYTNANLEVPFIVTNRGPGNNDISVKINDDQGYTLTPTEKTITLKSGENKTDKFIIHAYNTAGITDTVTISAQPISYSKDNFQYDTIRITTEDKTNKPTDTIDPVCQISAGFPKGTCTTVCGCEKETVEAETESSDEGFGIYEIVANNVGTNYTFKKPNFTLGITKSQGTVKTTLRVDCCRTKAYVTVTDFASRSTQCTIQVNSLWTPTGCTTTTSSSTITTKATTATTVSGNSTTTTSSTTIQATEENSTWLTTPVKIAIGAGAGVLAIAAITTGAILIKKKYSSVSPD